MGQLRKVSWVHTISFLNISTYTDHICKSYTFENCFRLMIEMRSAIQSSTHSLKSFNFKAPSISIFSHLRLHPGESTCKSLIRLLLSVHFICMCTRCSMPTLHSPYLLHYREELLSLDLLPDRTPWPLPLAQGPLGLPGWPQQRCAWWPAGHPDDWPPDHPRDEQGSWRCWLDLPTPATTLSEPRGR